MFAHTQVIQEVDEFFFIGDLEKCSITSLADQLIHCSEWVPSEWESGGRGGSLEEALLWIIDWDSGQKQLIFLSVVWMRILMAPIHIHWWANYEMLNFSKYDLVKEQTRLYLK